MDKAKLLTLLNREADTVWDSLCEIYPALCQYDRPVIKLNPYLWRVAGCNYQERNTVELGFKFFKFSPEYFNQMIDVILPHEMIHQADFNLFGLSEKKCGHGQKWCEMMINYGLPANPHHTMDIPRK